MRTRLLDMEDLERSLGDDYGPLDRGLAAWAIEIVSAEALAITRAPWTTPEDLPAGALAPIAMAVRRLYTNPDRFNRENEGDYGYGLDSSVTKADVFTPSERAQLREYSTRRRLQGLGTVSTYRGDEGGRWGRYVPDGTRHGLLWYAE